MGSLISGAVRAFVWMIKKLKWTSVYVFRLEFCILIGNCTNTKCMLATVRETVLFVMYIHSMVGILYARKGAQWHEWAGKKAETRMLVPRRLLVRLGYKRFFEKRCHVADFKAQLLTCPPPPLQQSGRATRTTTRVQANMQKSGGLKKHNKKRREARLFPLPHYAVLLSRRSELHSKL